MLSHVIQLWLARADASISSVTLTLPQYENGKYVGSKKVEDPMMNDNGDLILTSEMVNLSSIPVQFGEACWSGQYTEERCCPIDLETPTTLGDESCWHYPYLHAGCCLKDKTCEDPSFKQVLDLVPKYLSREMSIREHVMMDTLISKGFFMRDFAVHSCPPVALILGFLGGTYHLNAKEHITILQELAAKRMGSVSAQRHLQYNNWGLFEALSVMSGLHAYENLDENVGKGSYSEEVELLVHNNDAKQKLFDVLREKNVDMALVSNFSWQIAKSVDDLIVSAPTGPAIMHSAGKLGVLPRYPSREEQPIETRNQDKIIYLEAGEETVYFGKDHGEDGAVDAMLVVLFDRYLGHGSNPYYVEIGTQSGIECNSRYFRLARGWNGVMYDRDFANPYIRLRRLHVTTDNIIPNLDKDNVPQEVDLLSIDIDGMDFWIWRAVNNRVNARVVAIEVRPIRLADPRWNMSNEELKQITTDELKSYNSDYSWNGIDEHGTSLFAMNNLATELGYTLVSLNYQDAVYVRNDELEKLYDRTGVRFVTDARLLHERGCSKC